MKSYSWLSRIFLFTYICITPAFSISETDHHYTKYCSSFIPRPNITARSNDISLPSLSTSYFTGADSLMRMESGQTYYYVQRNLRLRLRPDYYETTTAGVYAVEGLLYLRFPYSSDGTPANSSYSRYNNHRRNRRKDSIRFSMSGVWSAKSRNLCMVGSGPWRGVDRDSVLKLKFDGENPTIYTGVVSGSLESTAPANSPPYFDPILIFSFPEFSNYKYSLVTEKISAAFPTRKGESLSLDASEFCSEMARGIRSLELEYASECVGRRPPHRCSPLGSGGELWPKYLSLTSIECVRGERKARFLATFSNYSRYVYEDFALDSTVIGEASWDDEHNRTIAVACEILDPIHNLGKAVGNCDMRLSLRHPSVLNIQNDARIVGEIWSSKGVEDSGYFSRINLNTDDNRAMPKPELRYEYTLMDRVRKSCKQKKAGKKGNAYPDGQSFDMRFDMNIRNGKGEAFGWAYVKPSWVENEPYFNDIDALIAPGPVEMLAVSDIDAESAATTIQPEKRAIARPIKMSYKILIYPRYNVDNINSSNISSSPGLDWQFSSQRSVYITAEGLYDDANGHLCMVGCRKLVNSSKTTFEDCEMVVEFELPPLNGRRGALTKGIIRSTRPKTDALHFDDLISESAAYYSGEAERSIWRMDLEIGMVLISSTLFCIFVALQIFHVKRNPEVPSFISTVMVGMLSVGCMIPLVLNFEAVFLGNRDKSTLELGSGGRVEANEVAVRVITMVALLLQLRLVQLVWTAKQRDGRNGERKAGLVSLLFYILGGLITLLINWIRNNRYGGYWRYSVWGDLRSYAGLILDGFLFPQILLNILRGSAEKALCHPFYVGTSAVRLVPHAYNQYRAHNYPKHDLNATYYYANPAADLYSTAWDIIIPCGIVALAVIVFVQQRHGGRCILPQRFRGLEMYEKVAIADDEEIAE